MREIKVGCGGRSEAGVAVVGVVKRGEDVSGSGVEVNVEEGSLEIEPELGISPRSMNELTISRMLGPGYGLVRGDELAICLASGHSTRV